MKKRLAVLFGSRSCEHDVSIITGLQALGAADKDKYEAQPVYIANDGQWYMGDALFDVAFYRAFDPDKAVRVTPAGENGKLVFYRMRGERRKLFSREDGPLYVADVALLALHGLNGEDGSIQGMFDMFNVPYTSSSILGSAVSMDKILMHKLFEGCGLPVLPAEGFTRAEWRADREGMLDRIERALSYPMYVKPANLGSSIGISRADNREGLANGLDVAAAYDRRLLVEQGVKKLKEVNCSVLGYDKYIRVSALEMPVTDDAFLTFDEKYLKDKKGGSQGMKSLGRVIPAPIPDEMADEIRSLSQRAFELLDLKGVVRIDYLIDEETNGLYIGEVNTIPGSLAVCLWEHAGVSFNELIDELVACALYAYEDRKASVYSYDSQILKKQGGGKVGGK